LPCFNPNYGHLSFIDGNGFKGYYGYSDFIEIIDFFRGDSLSRVQYFLQCKLNDYASFLLSHSWDQLGAKGYFENDELLHKIELEILPRKYFHQDNNIFPSDEQKRLLVKYVYQVTCALAQWVRGLLSNVQGVDFKNMNYLIVPTPSNVKERLNFAVELYEVNEAKLKGGIADTYFSVHVLPDLTKKKECLIEVNELKALKYEIKYKYGLLTKIKK